MSTGSQLFSLYQWLLILILALENNTQSFPLLLFSPTNVQGEKKSKLNTELWETPMFIKIHKAGRRRNKEEMSYTIPAL